MFVGVYVCSKNARWGWVVTGQGDKSVVGLQQGRKMDRGMNRLISSQGEAKTWQV